MPLLRRLRSPLLPRAAEADRAPRQPMIAPDPEHGAGELEQTQVVARLLVPADEDCPAFRQPRQRPFHHPPARLIALLAGWTQVSDEPDMGLVLVVDDHAPAGFVVVAFVQAQVLGVVGLGSGRSTATAAPRGSMRLRPVRLGGSSCSRARSTTRQRSWGTRQMVGRGLGVRRSTATSVRSQSDRVCLTAGDRANATGPMLAVYGASRYAAA